MWGQATDPAARGAAKSSWFVSARVRLSLNSGTKLNSSFALRTIGAFWAPDTFPIASVSTV